MTPSQVLVLRPPAASGYRLAWARERLHDTFWPIPALLQQAVRNGVAPALARPDAMGLG